MKILVYGINYSPELTGIGKFTGEMSEWLASRGDDVYVITAPPYYPEWRIGTGYHSAQYKRELRRGVKVLRCPIWVPKKQSGFRRILHLASFALSSMPPLLWESLSKRPDVILILAPAFFCAPGAWLAARMTGAKCWLHIQDFEMDAAFALGLLSSKYLKSLASHLESVVLRLFDKVTTISPNMVTRLIEKGVTESRSGLFPNWVDISLIRPEPSAGSVLRRELGLSEECVLALYSGNMGEKQGLGVLIDVAERLQNTPSLIFVLCGEGAAKERLMAQAKGLANVRFFPLQPLEKLNGLLNMADFHILPQRADAADLVLPSKLTGILASGKPVIATANAGTALARLVLEAGGLICPPEDVDELANRIMELTFDDEARLSRGYSARRFAEDNLSKEAILEQAFRIG